MLHTICTLCLRCCSGAGSDLKAHVCIRRYRDGVRRCAGITCRGLCCDDVESCAAHLSGFRRAKVAFGLLHIGLISSSTWGFSFEICRRSVLQLMIRSTAGTVMHTWYVCACLLVLSFAGLPMGSVHALLVILFVFFTMHGAHLCRVMCG